MANLCNCCAENKPVINYMDLSDEFGLCDACLFRATTRAKEYGEIINSYFAAMAILGNLWRNGNCVSCSAENVKVKTVKIAENDYRSYCENCYSKA
jgi:transcription elongation factor Elf1